MLIYGECYASQHTPRIPGGDNIHAAVQTPHSDISCLLCADSADSCKAEKSADPISGGQLRGGYEYSLGVFPLRGDKEIVPRLKSGVSDSFMVSVVSELVTVGETSAKSVAVSGAVFQLQQKRDKGGGYTKAG